EADRQLALADQAAPGFPEIAQARADLGRRRIAQPLPDDLRQLLAAIDTAMAERHYGDAERMIADGTRRYPSYTGWPDLSRRLADARRGPPPQTGNLPPPRGPRSQSASDDLRGAPLGDVVCRVARLAQDLVGVLAERRRRALD